MSYVSEMLRRKRVIAIYGEEGMECIILFFLTNEANLKTFSNRPMWSTPQDNEHGNIIFIDKMIARRWSSTLRRLVESEVVSRFPNVTQAQWLREPDNRNVIINKRGNYVHA